MSELLFGSTLLKSKKRPSGDQPVAFLACAVDSSRSSLHGRWQSVCWRNDGKELFYVALDDRLMAVPIRVASNAGAPEVGTPVTLFAPRLGGAVQQADYRHQYMLSSDGQAFLVATVTEQANSPITVILNWNPRTINLHRPSVSTFAPSTSIQCRRRGTSCRPTFFAVSSSRTPCRTSQTITSMRPRRRRSSAA